MLFLVDAVGSGTAVHTPGIDVNVTTSIPVPIAIQFKLYNILMPLLAIIIILINFIIVLSSGLILHRGQQHPRSTYIFLGNVALSDFFIGVAFIFGHFYPAVKRNEIVCCISVGMTVSSALVSVYSIGLIAIDRYLYILYGLRYQRYLSTNRARMMVAATWVLGAIVGYLPAMGIREFTDNGKWCWFIILVPRSLVLVTTSIGLIPLITIIVLYSIILKTALDKISNLKKAARESMGTSVGSLRLFRGGQDRNSVASNMNELNNNGGYINDDIDRLPRKRRGFWNCCRSSRTVNIAIAPVYNPSRWKAIKIVLFTTGSYFITWFPFFFASALYAVCDPQRTPVYCDNLKVTIASVLTILGMCNSILNPIIYAWWHNGFRESVMKIYRSMWSKLFESKSQHYNKRHSGVSSRTNITHITESSRPISRDSNNLSEELNVPRLLHHSEMINGEARDVDVEEEQLNPRPSRKHVRIEEVDEDEEPKKEMEKDDRPYNETML